MSINDDLVRLGNLVTKFEKIDSSIIQILNKGNLDDFWAVAENAFATKKVIKRLMSEHPPLNVHPGLVIKLRKIRDNYGYYIDLVFEAVAQKSGKSISQDAEEDMDYVEALFTKGTASYVDENFFSRKNEVGTLIGCVSFPDHFINHFENLRECYSLGLYQAAVIYCRAVIETGCFEALRRKGKVSLGSEVQDFREFHLKALMNSIKPFVYEPNWNKADKVIKKAAGILHSKRQKTNIAQADAYNAIKDTFAIIEELFSPGTQIIKKKR